MKSHPKKLKSRLPVLVSLPNTLVNLTSCKMIGHETNHNCGCIHINSHVFISDTEFVNFNAGGIYCLAKPKPVNKVKIMDSHLYDISNKKLFAVIKDLKREVQSKHVLSKKVGFEKAAKLLITVI